MDRRTQAMRKHQVVLASLLIVGCVVLVARAFQTPRPPSVSPVPMDLPKAAALDESPVPLPTPGPMAELPPVESVPNRAVASTMPPDQAQADPVGEVEDFIRQGQDRATRSIQALTAERQALRERLARVEAALARWEGVDRSLEAGLPAPQPIAPEVPDSPLELR